MKKVALFSLFLAMALGIYFSGVIGHLSLGHLQAQSDILQNSVSSAPVRSALVFFAFYFAVTSLSLPGAAVLTLAAGALFGFWAGTLIVSFASSCGASMAFLLSRYFFRDWLRKKFSRPLRVLEDGFARDGDQFLLLLRLVPAFPFFMVNLVAGLTPIPLRRFYLLSQLAMLPATAVYVNAGTELGKLQKTSDVLSLRLIVAFSLLGIFPLAVKKIVQRFHEKPRK